MCTLLLQNGFNVRVRSMHFVNAPAIADAMISLIKSFMKKKLAQRVSPALKN